MELCRVAGIDTLLREIVTQGAFENPHDLADFHMIFFPCGKLKFSYPLYFT